MLKLKKQPYTFSGHLDATVDPEKIEAMWAKFPAALVGVASGASGIVVADIDMGSDDKSGETHDGWGSLTEAGLDETLEGTFTYRTSRGGDHYIYLAPEGIPLGPTQNHETPEGVKLDDVDRRGGSSYIVLWTDDLPDSRDAFTQPPAWLLTPAREARVNPDAKFAGSIEEWFDKCVQGVPDEEVREALGEMVEKQGAITHQEMIEFQRYLVGQGADYLKPGIPEAIRTFRDLYVDYPDDSGKDWTREFDLGLAGAITKYGAFASGPRDILECEKGITWIAVSPELLKLASELPPVDGAEALVRRVQWVISSALTEGKDPMDAATLGWTSAAARAEGGIRQAMSQADALQWIWGTTWQVATTPVTADLGAPTETPAAEVAPSVETPPDRRVALLSEAEIAAVANTRWWGTEFMERMREWNNPINEQYFHLSMWMTLSLAFASLAHMAKGNGEKVPLNFYGVVVGPSNSGKSESIGIIRQIIDALELNNSWDLGGDATAAGLTQALIRRHMDGGGATLLHPDEADATLRNWSDERGPFADMKQRIMDIYMGRVPKMQRSTNRDISDVAAEAQLNVHLGGVKDKIADAILPDDWGSGFINRFVWAMGTRSQLTRDQLKVVLLGNEGKSADKSPVGHWVAQWTGDFRRTLSWLGEGTRVDLAPEVAERHVETRVALIVLGWKYSAYTERLAATFGRLEWTLLKCAALVAVSQRRRRIEMSDYLIALKQGEEWAENILTMVEATDESPRSREVTRLADLIRAAGGRMDLAAIHRSAAYRGDQRHANGLVDELIAQGRAERLEQRDHPTVIRLTKEAHA